jgi:hypothetical protein
MQRVGEIYIERTYKEHCREGKKYSLVVKYEGATSLNATYLRGSFSYF